MSSMECLPAPEVVAAEFCSVLHRWLDPATITEINRRNATPEYGMSCATHDFCDANQAMIDALHSFGLEFDHHLMALINAAWHLARERQFAIHRQS